jgi:hypothetical protein
MEAIGEENSDTTNKDYENLEKLPNRFNYCKMKLKLRGK